MVKTKKNYVFILSIILLGFLGTMFGGAEFSGNLRILSFLFAPLVIALSLLISSMTNKITLKNSILPFFTLTVGFFIIVYGVLGLIVLIDSNIISSIDNFIGINKFIFLMGFLLDSLLILLFKFKR